MMIRDYILEEKKDAKIYFDLADEMELEGHLGEAAILRDIARDEVTHTRHLENIEKNLEQSWNEN